MLNREYTRRRDDEMKESRWANNSGAYTSSFLFLFYIIGVAKANKPTLLKEFGVHPKLMDAWSRHLLRSMEWVKRKGITRKVEPSEKFLQE